MSSEYRSAIADGDPATRAAIRTSRDRFLRYRDRCEDEGCVTDAYADRVSEIRDIAAGRY